MSNMTMRMMVMTMCVRVKTQRVCESVWQRTKKGSVVKMLPPHFFLLRKIPKELARRHQHSCPHMLIACSDAARLLQSVQPSAEEALWERSD